MSNAYTTQSTTSDPPKVRITAGSAFKLGFFGALGLFVFYLLISVVLGIAAAVLFAAGLLPTLPLGIR